MSTHERVYTPEESYRSNLVENRALAGTLNSLRVQLGPEVLDAQDRAAESLAEASTERLAQLGQEYANNALQATLGASVPQSAEVDAHQANQNAGPIGPLPGFGDQAPMVEIEQMRRQDVDLAA